MGLLFSFRGRVGRLVWWGAGLLVFALYGAGRTLIDNNAGLAASVTDQHAMLSFLGMALILMGAWCNLAVTAKRYHDRNKSGFWYLVIFIPLIGWIWQVAECGFLSGDPGPNDFGLPGNDGLASEGGADDEIAALREQAREARGGGAQAGSGSVPAVPAIRRGNGLPPIGAKPAFGRRGM